MELDEEEDEEDPMLTMVQGNKQTPLEAIDARIPHFERLAEKLLQVCAQVTHACCSRRSMCFTGALRLVEPT
eukprot:6735101-Pyramimonas_sp.AAC.1